MKRTLWKTLALAVLCALLIPAARAEEGVAVRCAEQGFSTRMPAGLTAEWQEGDGLYIWGKDPGYVPNVQVWRRSAKLKDPVKYVSETYPAHMRDTWGDRLMGSAFHEIYETGGKQLTGGSYIYKGASGASINLVHLVEVREDGDVEYIARYLNGERAATLAILSMAVRYYTPDGAQAAGTASPLRGTAVHDDGRFSVTLPAGWTILTQSEYTSFCFKAWDPAQPDRAIFLFMKLEPFLKSQAAKQTFQRVNDSLGGRSIYALSADAPVMESCTLRGFLDSLPQVRAFCEKYCPLNMAISPEVLPDMRNVRITGTKKSPLPAPADCGENVIACVTFKDRQGRSCEGIVTAQPVNTPYVDFYGVDGWPNTVYLFMGVTAPAGEMQALAPVLTECLGSFAFSERYVRRAVDISTEETQALLAQARLMQAAHDAMAEAWAEMMR